MNYKLSNVFFNSLSCRLIFKYDKWCQPCKYAICTLLPSVRRDVRGRKVLGYAFSGLLALVGRYGCGRGVVVGGRGARYDLYNHLQQAVCILISKVVLYSCTSWRRTGVWNFRGTGTDYLKYVHISLQWSATLECSTTWAMVNTFCALAFPFNQL